MTSTTRTTIAVAAFVAAAIVAAIALRGAETSDTAPKTERSASTAATSDIWEVGDGWVVDVSQDSGSITPAGTKSIATVAYRFNVVEAPATGDAEGAWKVAVTQDGAEGPFADGWSLYYQEQGGAMVLWKVAQGKLKPMEAELATIVLGMGFPYETKLTALPKPKTTISAVTLQARAALPPALPAPTSKNTGALPPTDAPNIPAGELPPGAPGA